MSDKNKRESGPPWSTPRTPIKLPKNITQDEDVSLDTIRKDGRISVEDTTRESTGDKVEDTTGISSSHKEEDPMAMIKDMEEDTSGIQVIIEVGRRKTVENTTKDIPGPSHKKEEEKTPMKNRVKVKGTVENTTVPPFNNKTEEEKTPKKNRVKVNGTVENTSVTPLIDKLGISNLEEVTPDTSLDMTEEEQRDHRIFTGQEMPSSGTLPKKYNNVLKGVADSMTNGEENIDRDIGEEIAGYKIEIEKLVTRARGIEEKYSGAYTRKEYYKKKTEELENKIDNMKKEATQNWNIERQDQMEHSGVVRERTHKPEEKISKLKRSYETDIIDIMEIQTTQSELETRRRMKAEERAADLERELKRVRNRYDSILKSRDYELATAQRMREDNECALAEKGRINKNLWDIIHTQREEMEIKDMEICASRDRQQPRRQRERSMSPRRHRRRSPSPMNSGNRIYDTWNSTQQPREREQRDFRDRGTQGQEYDHRKPQEEYSPKEYTDKRIKQFQENRMRDESESRYREANRNRQGERRHRGRSISPRRYRGRSPSPMNIGRDRERGQRERGYDNRSPSPANIGRGKGGGQRERNNNTWSNNEGERGWGVERRGMDSGYGGS